MLEGDLEADKGIVAGARLLHAIVPVALQQVLCHRRHDRPREEIRRKHGENDRLSQRNEQIAATPLRKNMGTNTMQMARVETKAGTESGGAGEDGARLAFPVPESD